MTVVAAAGAMAATPAVAADHDAKVGVPLHQGGHAVLLDTKEVTAVVPVHGNSLPETRSVLGSMTPAGVDGAVQKIAGKAQIPVPKTDGAMVGSDVASVERDTATVDLPGGGVPKLPLK
ncbi:hypothetical protein [Streptomyces sp. S.PB5]|uniref:hypothetical protein n=1 Tax=Streptomyces sp. S.PB5 TaxID=3020844 RepID=UPI0025AF080C|nr:hypothetical protein [Streptomyces sp. S.PB5]MDN3022796.1 hypothetical protein [Streptomyces sp. S.PB5]